MLFLIPLNANGETGQGTDVFKVIMTIFGINEPDDDVVAIVSVKDGEGSRVKFLDANGPYVVPLNSTEGETNNFIEYVATFPNVTVNVGDQYQACVLTIKGLHMICNESQNSPASRPEIIDIDINNSTESEED